MPTTPRCTARASRRVVWRDPEYADRLEREAADLKRRFNHDFWIEDGEYFAIALDYDGRQVDSLTSNNGHLLWSGIVDKSKARAVVRHLMEGRLFSGWGVRTLAEGEARYNPIGYHLGTIWPFDNSFIAWGLRRYGFKEEAARIAEVILEAAGFFGGILPEAFGGYPRRTKTDDPVPYPTACSPQAWSTGTPLLLLATMLGLQPVGEHLVVDSRATQRHRGAPATRYPGAVGAHRHVRPGDGGYREGTQAVRQASVIMIEGVGVGGARHRGVLAGLRGPGVGIFGAGGGAAGREQEAGDGNHSRGAGRAVQDRAEIHDVFPWWWCGRMCSSTTASGKGLPARSLRDPSSIAAAS